MYVNILHLPSRLHPVRCDLDGGLGKSFKNVSLLIAITDTMVSYAYGFDAKSIVGVMPLEHRREEAFRTYWNDNCAQASIDGYYIAGAKHHRRLFHALKQGQ